MNSVFKLSNIFMILLGNAAMALGIVMFILPNGLMTGGTTGLSLIVGHYYQPADLGVRLSVQCRDVYSRSGRPWQGICNDDAAQHVFLSGCSGVFSAHPGCRGRDHRRPAPVQSLWRAVIGFALGIVIRAGAVHGRDGHPAADPEQEAGAAGTGLLYAFDIVILIGQMLFSDKEAILYGILLVMTYTIVLDKVLVFGRAQTQVKIISERVEEINTAINRRWTADPP